VINVAAVWLLWSKRLFGLNGGGAAYRAEHSAESLLTVERAALDANLPARSVTVGEKRDTKSDMAQASTLRQGTMTRYLARLDADR
jgi:hypothetical protein